MEEPRQAIVDVTEERPEGPVSVGDGDFGLLSFLSGELRKAVAAVPEELWVMSETQLRGQAAPTANDYAIRVSFWREFEKAMWRVDRQSGKACITAQGVFAGIVTDQYFYGKFLKNPKKVAWMARPMQRYHREMEALLARATERLWEMVDVPIKDKLGRLDKGRAEFLLKVIREITDRAKGMAVQRIQGQTKNLHAHQVLPPPPVAPVAAAQAGSLADIEDRLEKLRQEVEAAAALPAPEAPVTIEVKEVEREPVPAPGTDRQGS